MENFTASLKAVVSEPKITSKNAWKSTIIEDFSNISSLESHQDVNFQKASTALDSCIKVYTTRIDDVAACTAKLLGVFSQEKEQKKRTKKREIYIENNLQNINLKLRNDERFVDPVFSSLIYGNDFTFLTDILQIKKNSIYLYEDETQDDNEVIVNEEAEDLDVTILPVSPGLRSIKKRGIDVNEEIVYYEPNFSENNDDVNDENNNEEPETDYENVEVSVNPVIYDETPFSYFRGWRSPSQWKILKKEPKSNSKVGRTKEAFFLDFCEEVHTASLFERGDATMSKEAIMERRKKRNILPEDLYYEPSDLYKFFILEGYFRRNLLSAKDKSESVANSAPEKDLQLLNAFSEIKDGNMSVELEAESIIDLSDQNPPTIRPLHKSLQKRVDIKKLKENILMCINTSDCKVTDIFRKVTKKYEEEEKEDISVHQCVVSLLFLANENDIILSATGSDLLVKSEIPAKKDKINT